METQMEFSKGRITIERELSELDRFTLDFAKVLARHTEYVIISGYISILLGRSRMSEDVDIIIPKMDEASFLRLHAALSKAGFVCINSGKPYEYISDKVAVRYARKDKVIPNIELKFAKNNIDEAALKCKIKVQLAGDELSVSGLELQIAFKEEVLCSPKDIEDARHIREVAKGHLDEAKIKEWRKMLHGL